VVIVLSSPFRLFVVAVLTAALLTAGLIGPAAGQPAPDLPATVARRLDGLPAQRAGGRVSKPVTTPIPFSMVGFDVPDGTELEFRASVDGHAWGKWTPVEVNPEEGPDAGSEEDRATGDSTTEPVWVGEARALQTRLSGRPAAAHPEHAAVHLIDSSGLGRSWSQRVADRARAVWRGTPASAAASVGRPEIVTRDQWGADESLRGAGPYYASRIVAGLVHHTAGANNYTRSQADDVVRGVYRYHTQSRGWNDIGYNFLVDRFGTVYEGRYGGVTQPVIGAHAGGFNTGTFGVSLMGSFSTTHAPRVMRRALRELLAWKFDLHHTNVLGTTQYTSYGSSKYAAGQTVTINRLSGHRDVSSTTCPGGSVYSLLPGMRKRIAEMQGPVVLNPTVSHPQGYVAGGSVVGGPVTLSAYLRPSGPWSVDIVDEVGATVYSKTGDGLHVTARWAPTNAQPGVYRYAVHRTDARAATGTIALEHPSISGGATPRSSVLRPGGTLSDPITFTGQLYEGANWSVRVFDPAGQRVHLLRGTGSSVSTTWNGPGEPSPAGMYTWVLRADDTEPVRGSVRLLSTRVGRAATSESAATAAVSLSQSTFELLAARRVVLTREDLPKFALSAGPVAGMGGPVLYASQLQIATDTMAEIQRVLPAGGRVIVMGDVSVISDAALAPLVATYDVRRVDVRSPVKAAGLAADIVLGRSHARRALVVGSATGAWRQAAAAAGYGARAGVPILLTDRSTLSTGAADAIARNGVTGTTIVGDEQSVSDAVRRQLPRPTRIGGETRADVAAAAARRLYGRTAAADGQRYLFFNPARDDGWVRVLAAAPRTARLDAPPLVVGRTSVPEPTTSYLRRLDYRANVLGQGAVLGNGDHAATSVKDALSRSLQ
jgi:hypothetical protein